MGGYRWARVRQALDEWPPTPYNGQRPEGCWIFAISDWRRPTEASSTRRSPIYGRPCGVPRPRTVKITTEETNRGNIAPFKPGPGLEGCAEDRLRSLDGTSPHSNRGRVAFSTLRPPRLWLFGGPAPWTKRGKRTTCAALFGVGRADRGGSRRDRTSPHSSSGECCRGAEDRQTVLAEHRPIQARAAHCRSAATTGGAVWTTSPCSNRGRVAFPTLRPPRLRLYGGPAPWAKRGKRTTAVALVGIGSAAGPRARRHRQKPTPGDTRTDALSIDGTALTGLSTLCPRRRSPVNQIAVVKAWVTPTTNSADARSGPSRRCGHPNIAPFIRGGRADENRPKVDQYCGHIQY